MKNLTRDEIADFINNEFGLTKKDCIGMVNELIEEIISGLIKNEFVKIHNFGTFKLRKKKARIGRNPKTKVEAKISSRKVVKFKPSILIKKKLNQNEQ